MSIADGMIGVKSKKEARRAMNIRNARDRNQNRDCRVCGGGGFMDVEGGDCKHCAGTGRE